MKLHLLCLKYCQFELQFPDVQDKKIFAETEEILSVAFNIKMLNSEILNLQFKIIYRETETGGTG